MHQLTKFQQNRTICMQIYCDLINLGTVCYLGFNRKSILTIPQAPQTHNAPHTKFQQNRTKHS